MNTHDKIGGNQGLVHSGKEKKKEKKYYGK